MTRTQASVLSAAAAIAVGTAFAGQALADPEQGGVNPSGPSQGGVTSAPSAPSQGGVTPDPDPGPGAIPDPPQELPYRAVPSYDSGSPDTSYNATPVITTPQHVINRAAPVQPIAAPEGKVRIGTFMEDKPGWLSDADARSINRWASYGEAKISQGWRAVGMSDKEADRRAAATILGVAVGGTVGATALGVPAAVVGGVGGAVIGGVIGTASFFPAALGVGPLAVPTPLVGALIGGAAGAAALGIPAALVGAVTGGLLGGVIGNFYGAGDDKADPNQPLLPWQEPQLDSSPKVYRFNLPAPDAQRAGLPAVDYTVNVRGDVRAQVGDSVLTWTGEQAMAPYAALGGAAQGAEQAVADWTQRTGQQLQGVVHGLNIVYGPAATSEPVQASGPAQPAAKHAAAQGAQAQPAASR